MLLGPPGTGKAQLSIGLESTVGPPTSTAVAAGKDPLPSLDTVVVPWTMM
jgi:hypothetical protein